MEPSKWSSSYWQVYSQNIEIDTCCTILLPWSCNLNVQLWLVHKTVRNVQLNCFLPLFLFLTLTFTSCIPFYFCGTVIMVSFKKKKSHSYCNFLWSLEQVCVCIAGWHFSCVCQDRVPCNWPWFKWCFEFQYAERKTFMFSSASPLWRLVSFQHI